MTRPIRGRARRIYDPRGVPSDVEQRELVQRAQAGDVDARNELVVRNYGLAATMAARYGGTPEWQEDLTQQGVFGLMRAAERYDPDHPVRFNTYAACWIKQAIAGYIADRAGMIRVPRYINGRKAREHRLARSAARARRFRSLDADGEGAAHADLLAAPGPDATMAAIDAEDRELAGRLADAVDSLDDDGRDLIRSRFGLGDCEPETCRAVARRRGWTDYHARKVEARALRRLRAMVGA